MTDFTEIMLVAEALVVVLAMYTLEYVYNRLISAEDYKTEAVEMVKEKAGLKSTTYPEAEEIRQPPHVFHEGIEFYDESMADIPGDVAELVSPEGFTYKADMTTFEHSLNILGPSLPNLTLANDVPEGNESFSSAKRIKLNGGKVSSVPPELSFGVSRAPQASPELVPQSLKQRFLRMREEDKRGFEQIATLFPDVDREFLLLRVSEKIAGRSRAQVSAALFSELKHGGYYPLEKDRIVNSAKKAKATRMLDCGEFDPDEFLFRYPKPDDHFRKHREVSEPHKRLPFYLFSSFLPIRAF